VASSSQIGTCGCGNNISVFIGGGGELFDIAINYYLLIKDSVHSKINYLYIIILLLHIDLLL
jgi:hypothetical protein